MIVNPILTYFLQILPKIQKNYTFYLNIKPILSVKRDVQMIVGQSRYTAAAGSAGQEA